MIRCKQITLSMRVVFQPANGLHPDQWQAEVVGLGYPQSGVARNKADAVYDLFRRILADTNERVKLVEV